MAPNITERKKQNLIGFIFRCLEGFTFFDVAVQFPVTLGAGSGSLKGIWHPSSHVRLFDFLSDRTVSKSFSVDLVRRVKI